MRTVEEFKESVKKNNIKRWDIHKCSICGFNCGYIFDIYNDQVYYDSGCDCVTYFVMPHPRSWNEVAEYYNMQTNPKYIAEMDEFWHFDS